MNIGIGAGEGTRTPMPRRQILSLMRLPISPHPHYGYYCTKNLGIRLLLLLESINQYTKQIRYNQLISHRS